VHLERILEKTRATLAERKRLVSAGELRRQAEQHMPRGFARSLRKASESGPAILAELKKASPSKGLIRPDFDPQALAQSLQDGGAAALSVLTDEPFFQGSLRNLEIASAATALPCLRKDFIVDEYQIVEARAHGADAILLIVAALADDQLLSFTEAAHGYGLDVLCEVHSAAELDRAAGLGCDAYGINNRDLQTFEVNLETSLQLVDRLPTDAVRIAESGIHTAEHLERLRNAGFDAFLIGESLMRHPDPGSALRDLLAGVASLESVSAWDRL
jgi:indole-3-glycerol phosphate synthase